MVAKGHKNTFCKKVKNNIKMFSLFDDFNDFGLYNRRQRAPPQRRQQCACNECRKTQRTQKRQGQNTSQRKAKLSRRKSPIIVEKQFVDKPIRTEPNRTTSTQRKIHRELDRQTIESRLERMHIGNRDILMEEPLLVELEQPEFSTEDELVPDEEIITEPDE